MLQSEYERRRQAVSRVRAGDTVVSAARSVGRTEQWLHKWLRRYEAEGEPPARCCPPVVVSADVLGAAIGLPLPRRREPHSAPTGNMARLGAEAIGRSISVPFCLRTANGAGPGSNCERP